MPVFYACLFPMCLVLWCDRKPAGECEMSLDSVIYWWLLLLALILNTQSLTLEL